MVLLDLDPVKNLLVYRDEEDRPWVFRDEGQPVRCAVTEAEGALVVSTRLASVEDDDLDIEIGDNLLRIEARQAPSADQPGRCPSVEHLAKTLRLFVGVPLGVDTTKVRARRTDDLLEISVPKGRPRRLRRLVVERSRDGGEGNPERADLEQTAPRR